MANSHWYGYMGSSVTYDIVGIPYRSKEIRQLFTEKSSSTVILLKREKGNRYDDNAIAVYAALTLSGDASYKWHKVGYVASKIANDEFRNLPLDHVLEARKYGPTSFQLTGGVRKYRI